MENKTKAESRIEENRTYRLWREEDVRHLVTINPDDKYLCLDSCFVHLLAHLSDKQLKEVFSLLDESTNQELDDWYNASEDPIVNAVLNMIDMKGIQFGRTVVDYVGL